MKKESGYFGPLWRPYFLQLPYPSLPHLPPDLLYPPIPSGYKIATQACIGFLSRDDVHVEGFEGGVWTNKDLYDDMWLALLEGMAPANNKKGGEELLDACLGNFNSYISYDWIETRNCSRKLSPWQQ